MGEIEDRKEKLNAHASIFNNLELANKALFQFTLPQSYFHKALRINRRIGNQFREANILKNLAALYIFLNEAKKFITNLKKSIQSYQKALEIRTKEHFPMNYASTQNSLGAAHHTLAQVKDKAKNIQLAKKAYQEALKIYNKEEYPDVYELINKNIQILGKKLNK